MLPTGKNNNQLNSNYSKFCSIFIKSNSSLDTLTVAEISKKFIQVFDKRLYSGDIKKFLERSGFAIIKNGVRDQYVTNIRFKSKEEICLKKSETIITTNVVANDLSEITNDLADIKTAKILLESSAFKNKLFRIDNYHILKELNSGIWLLNPKEILGAMYRILTTNSDFFKTSQFTHKVISSMLLNAPLSPSNFLERFYSNEGQIPFNNGVYFVETKTFVPGFDNTYFFKKIDINFPVNNTDPNIVNRDFAMNSIIKPTLGDIIEENKVGIYLLRFLAKILAGESNKMKFMVAIGSRNTAKTTFFELINMAIYPLGSTYNSKNLFVTKKSSDNELANKWMIDGIGRLLLTSSESEMTKTDVLSAERIKKAQGGDYQMVRDSRSSNTFALKNQAVILLCVNNYPKLDKIDVLETSYFVRFSRNFVSLEQYNNLTDIQKKTHSIIDDTLKRKVSQSESLRLGIIFTILDYYLNGRFIEPEVSVEEKFPYFEQKGKLEGNINFDIIFILKSGSDCFINQKLIGIALETAGYKNTAENIGVAKNYLVRMGCISKKKNTNMYINGKNAVQAYMNVIFFNDTLNYKRKDD